MPVHYIVGSISLSVLLGTQSVVEVMAFVIGRKTSLKLWLNDFNR